MSVDPDVSLRLISDAKNFAMNLGCSRVDLRDSVLRTGSWPISLDKVTFELPLPETNGQLLKQLGAKVRSQIRRADRESISVRIGGIELVPDFYRVFSENMRDLGTPVYPRGFFESIMKFLADRTKVVVVDWDGRPAGAALLIKTRDRVEVPWASSIGASRPVSLNMRLYADLFRVAIDWGAHVFDFGRCSVDSGTYRFKKQWGAVPRQLYWYHWHRGEPPESVKMGDRRGGLELASSLWKKLPLPIANFVGPIISPGLPW